MKNTTVLLLGVLPLCACGEQARLKRALEKYDKTGTVTAPFEDVADGRQPGKSRQATAGIVVSKEESERKYMDVIDLSGAMYGSGSGKGEPIMERLVTLTLRGGEGTAIADCEASLLALFSYGSASEKGAYIAGEHPLAVAAAGDMVVVSFDQVTPAKGPSVMSGCEVLEVVNKSVSLPKDEQ